MLLADLSNFGNVNPPFCISERDDFLPVTIETKLFIWRRKILFYEINEHIKKYIIKKIKS